MKIKDVLDVFDFKKEKVKNTKSLAAWKIIPFCLFFKFFKFLFSTSVVIYLFLVSIILSVMDEQKSEIWIVFAFFLLIVVFIKIFWYFKKVPD